MGSRRVGCRLSQSCPLWITSSTRKHPGDPVFKTISPVLSAPTVCMVGLPLGLSVLREHEASLCPIGISFDALIPWKLLRSMSADDHPGYRRLFQRAFRDDVVEACLPEIEGIVGSGLSQLADESVRSAPRGLAPRSYLESLVLTAFLQLFFGLTPDSVRAKAAATQLLHIGQDVGGRIGGRRYRKVALAADGLASIIREQGALLCDGQQSGTEPPRSFLEALLRERPDALDDPTITFNLVFLARTAATDVTGLLHWILKMLGDNQEWIGALRASTDRTDLAQRVVMETLRLEQSELLFRTVREEINVGGYVVPAGWHLRVCVRESHQDQSVFDRPDDSTRPLPTTIQPPTVFPLGAQGHTCLGARTIHALAGSFVEQVATGYDLVVSSDGDLEFDQHWRPGRHYRIVLRPRTA